MYNSCFYISESSCYFGIWYWQKGTSANLDTQFLDQIKYTILAIRDYLPNTVIKVIRWSKKRWCKEPTNWQSTQSIFKTWNVDVLKRYEPIEVDGRAKQHVPLVTYGSPVVLFTKYMTELCEVSIEHLQQVLHTNRWRLLLPIGTFKCSNCWDRWNSQS